MSEKISIEQLHKEIDLSEKAVETRRRFVRKMLMAYKDHSLSENAADYLRNEISILVRSGSALSEREEKSVQIMCLHYIAPEPFTARQLAQMYNVTVRTVHDHIKTGIEQLTIFIFGIGGVAFFVNSPEDEARREEKFAAEVIEKVLSMLSKSNP